MTDALLTARGVQAFYGKIQALKGVDIDVKQGEIVTLIGSNGAGKSTLMMTICGNPRARARHASLFDGHDITQMPTHEIARLGIAQSPEGRRIFPRMTRAGKPADGRHRHRPQLFRAATRSASSRCSRSLEGAAGPARRHAVGRRAADAGDRPRADGRPRLLLLDEPSLGLAPLIVKQIFDAIRQFNENEGLTVFLVEQNAYHALKLAHRAYVMVNGPITMTRHRQGTAVAPGSARRLSRRRPLSHVAYFRRQLGIFVLLTVILGGGAAFLAGRTLAKEWRPLDLLLLLHDSAWRGRAFPAFCALRA